MEITITRDGQLSRVLLFDDRNDPYQMHNIPYMDNPELFAGLCGILSRKLKESNDIWYREGIMKQLLLPTDAGVRGESCK